MKLQDIALASAIAGFGWLIIMVATAGAFYPDYNHISQFMSELGAQGVDNANWVNFGGFLVASIFFLIAIILSYRFVPKDWVNNLGFGILALFPILMAISAFAPCDFACRPETPSTTHGIHMASALFAYLSAILGLAILSFHAHKWMKTRYLKIFSLSLPVILIALFVNMMPENPYVGLVQRTLEVMIFSWFILIVARIRQFANGA
jgi:hypothetical protein